MALMSACFTYEFSILKCYWNPDFDVCSLKGCTAMQVPMAWNRARVLESQWHITFPPPPKNMGTPPRCTGIYTETNAMYMYMYFQCWELIVMTEEMQPSLWPHIQSQVLWHSHLVPQRAKEPDVCFVGSGWVLILFSISRFGLQCWLAGTFLFFLSFFFSV